MSIFSRPQQQPMRQNAPPPNGHDANQPPNNAQNIPNGGDKNTNNTDNNTSNNTEMVDNIWNELAADGTNNPNNVNNNAGNNANSANNQNNIRSDPQAELRAHFESVGLGDFTLSDADKAALRSGEGVDEIFNRFNHRVQTAYAKALSNSSTIMDAKIEAAVDKAVKTSRSYYQGEQIREMLADDAGIIGRLAKNPIFQPVVESVFKRFAEKPGSSIPKAMDATRMYLGRMHKELDPDYIEPNSNTNQQYSSRQPINRQQKTGPVGENATWLDVLRNK